MAYTSATLSLMWQNQSGTRKRWAYETADPIATVRAAGYISDATLKGMNVRDLVEVYSTTPTIFFCPVLSITAGAADLGDGLQVPETNT